MSLSFTASRLAAWARAALLLACVAALSGCASSLSARVTSYQQWPGDAVGQTYRIVPGAGQVAESLEYQAAADMIRAAIGATGLVEASAGQAARFELSFDIRNPVSQTWVQRYDDTLYPGFSPFFGYYGGYYARGMGIFYAPPVVNVPVDVYRNTLTVTLLDNRQQRAEVYRASAVHESTHDNLIGVLPYLSQAVFDGFPGGNGQVREVRYPVDAR